MECATSHSALFCSTVFISFFIGPAWLAIAFVKDIRTDLGELNAIIASNGANGTEMKIRFRYISRFYLDAKQLSVRLMLQFSDWIRNHFNRYPLALVHRFVNEFSKVYEFLITALLLWSVLSLSSALLLLMAQLVEYLFWIYNIEQCRLISIDLFFPNGNKYYLKSAQNANPIELIFTLFRMVASFLFILFMCEFGETASDQFELFEDELNQSMWYTMPIEMQQLLLTFMSTTRRPAIFRGYGNFECTRETFKKVCSVCLLQNSVHFHSALPVFCYIQFHFRFAFHPFKTIKCGFSYFMSLWSISQG